MTQYDPRSAEVQLDANSLVQIFSFLETKDKQNAAQVCQYWRDVVYIPSLWTNVRVVLHNRPRASLIRSLCKRGINRFVFRGSTDQDLALLFKTNCHITSLEINGCRNVTQQFLQNNLGKLNDLVSLHIAQCKQVNVYSLYRETSLDDVLARLKSITIPKCQDFSGFKLQEILQKCPCLERIDYDGDLALDLETIPEVLPKCPKLQRLKLGYQWFSSRSNYHERWKEALSMLNLKVLDLATHNYTHEDDISELADIFHNLESLSICITHSRLSVYTLSCLFKNNPNLKHFALDIEKERYYFEEEDDREEIDDRALCYEIPKLRKLESLRISLPCGLLSGEVIYNVVEGLPSLKQLELGAVGSISAEYADLIGDQLPKLRSLKIATKENNIFGIGILCSKLPSLTDLTIKHVGLLNRDVIQMSTNARCSGLKSLNIAGSKKIKDDGIKCIANTFKSLTSLDASSCSLSDSGLAVIIEQLNHLQSLSVTGKKITNYGAIMIGKHLKGLEHLKISGTKIGDQGFAFICSQLPRLQTLEAICKLLTGQGFQEGAQWLGGLTTLRIGSHRICINEFLQSAKHLKSVVELTIRSVSINQHFFSRLIKQMPCLSLLRYYCCSPDHRYSRIYFAKYCSPCGKACKTNGVDYQLYNFPCREHDYDARQSLSRQWRHNWVQDWA